MYDVVISRLHLYIMSRDSLQDLLITVGGAGQMKYEGG
jgi:hypothetical protein